MMDKSANSTQRDVSLPLALILFGLVVMAIVFLNLPYSDSELRDMERELMRHIPSLIVTAASILLNLVWLSHIWKREVTLTRQGSRLKKLRGENGNRKSILAIAGVTFLLLAPCILASRYLLKGLDYFLETQSFALFGMSSAFAGFNWSLSIAILCVGIHSLYKAIPKSRRRMLSAFPQGRETIVLGSTGDDDKECVPQWELIGKKGLNGNVLVTGSIGSGKTAGAILPYLDQILSNFGPDLCCVALDPKGTFIPEAKKLAEKHGFSERIVHMTLNGSVKFNPVYCDNPLREANFLAVAEMVRAAAINFVGRSVDSPFWEISGFNLIKNCLVYCSAVHGYYTLKDLYSAMVRAGHEDLSEDLKRLLKDDSKKFDKEESYNIQCTIEYFEHEYMEMDEKLKSGILATSTAFLNQFNEYRCSQIFCPAEGDLTFKSMDSLIDDGKILLFDIKNPGLAKSMGTFIKLHYQQSVLNRLSDPKRTSNNLALLIMDEYQDVVTTGAGSSLGDDRFLAKGREANAVTIAASQSLTSIINSVGKEKAAFELIQNFRTRIAGHSSDVHTIKVFQELMGQYEKEKGVHSIGELSQRAERNFLLGGFDSDNANISESFSSSLQKEYYVTGKEFSRLRSFETYTQIYDGESTFFKKLFLKPHFLKARATLQQDLVPAKRSERENASSTACAVALVLSLLFSPFKSAEAFPDVCSVVKAVEFRSCLNMNVSTCTCGWPPRPCAKISYYVPQTFIEVSPDPGTSHFAELPGAAAQLAKITGGTPFGVEGDTDTVAYHAHTLAVPFASIPFSTLPCQGARMDKMCFDGMSEHLGENWSHGMADSLQPQFLAWSLSPKACLIKGTVTSPTGDPGTPSGSEGGCSVPMDWLPKYPPSSHPACNGWGTFYPRSGIYNGPASTTAALMIASRMKSLSSEVFHSTPGSPDEKWQMISPQSSSCFREGQNVGLLETVKGVRELGRLSNGKLKGHLFVVWKKVSCCKDLPTVPAAYAALEAMSAVCSTQP